MWPPASRPFGNHRIGAATLHASSQSARRHHGNDFRPCLFPLLYVLARASRAGRYDVDAKFREHIGHFVRLRVHEHDIRSDRIVRHGTGNAHLFFNPGDTCPAARDDPQPASRRNSSGKPAVGNAGHGSLDDGVLDAEQLGNTRIHI